MKVFSMKDLGEAKTIIRWEITWRESTFKIDQKEYIQDLLEPKKMISYHLNVFLVKKSFTLFINQAGDHI